MFFSITDHEKRKHTVNPGLIVRFIDGEDLPPVVCDECLRVPNPGDEDPVEVCPRCLNESGKPRRSSLVCLADGSQIRLDVTQDQAAAGIMQAMAQAASAAQQVISRQLFVPGSVGRRRQ